MSTPVDLFPEPPAAVERAAEAIVRKEGALEWDALSEALRDYPRDLARAALAAALEVEEIAGAVELHTPVPSGKHLECWKTGCDFRVPWDDDSAWYQFGFHTAAAVRAALLGAGQ